MRCVGWALPPDSHRVGIRHRSWIAGGNMNRRDFISGTAAVGIPFQTALAQTSPPRYTGKPELKITDVEAFIVNLGRNYVYVKVSTDQGIYGWGEAYSAGPDEATVATVRDFREWLLGKDPRNVEYLWATMYNFTRFPGGLVVNAAISGIEHALWDIAGKAAGLPVYMLLGGKCRNKIRCYQAANDGETAQRLIAKYGYTAIKATFSQSSTMPTLKLVRTVAQRSEARRNAVGPDVDLCFDAHGTIWEPYVAFEVAEALKPIKPLFLEEAIRPENIDAMSELRRKVRIPIATGEELYTKYQFQELLAKGAA